MVPHDFDGPNSLVISKHATPSMAFEKEMDLIDRGVLRLGSNGLR